MRVLTEHQTKTHFRIENDKRLVETMRWIEGLAGRVEMMKVKRIRSALALFVGTRTERVLASQLSECTEEILVVRPLVVSLLFEASHAAVGVSVGVPLGHVEPLLYNGGSDEVLAAA